MTISRKIEGSKAVLALEGRLDTISAPELETALKETISGADSLEFDLEKLEYISSAGLRVLLSARKAMSGREMQVSHVNEVVMEVFEITGFKDVLTIV